MHRSPQADIIDELIWSKLGSFWTDAYNPADKDVLSAIYESMFTVLDAEYVRLFEINQAKSVTDCPVFSQRRWVRLDMNKYAQVRAFLQFLQAGTAGLSGGLAGNVLQCANVPTQHSKHWHISFPWQIKDIAPELRGLISLKSPISTIALVEIYKIQEGVDGVKRGTRLMPRTAQDSLGWDFELLTDGCTIKIRNPIVNEQYEVLVGFDLGSSTYAGLHPRVFRVENFLGPNICQVPDSMSDGLPVHAMVVRNPPMVGTSGLESTNREDFDTTRIFFPFTGDDSGVQHGPSGSILLPAGTVIEIGDVVYLFGTEAGVFDTLHSHKRDSVIYERSDVVSGYLTSHSPSVQIPLGLFGSIDFLGQQLHLFVNGRMIAPSEYNFEYASNTFYFRRPLSIPGTGPVYVDVLYMEETRGDASIIEPYHVHQQCFRGSVEVPKQFATFDDGGTFDDEDTNPPATFDDYDYDNTVYINDLLLTSDQIEVFVNGVLLEPDEQYVVTQEPKRTRISFKLAVESANVLVTVIRSSRIYVYGLDDIVPSNAVFGISLDGLRNILSDLQNVVAQFETTFGSKIADLAVLLDAAFIAAGGGNPLLALFLDEFKEYDGLPLDAPDQLLSATEARTVESANTKLIALPFLSDRVMNSTVRLESGAQFDYASGNIQSSIDLTAPRGDNDPSPGVWWCPVIFLDEAMLAKNFGTLVGDVRPDSSVSYRNSLAANLMLRYGGPTMQSITNTAAIMLGSDMFTQDSKILRLSERTTAYNIAVTSTSGSRQEVFTVAPTAPLPLLGAPVYPGQSIAFPLIADVVLSNLSTWEPGILTVNGDLGMVQTGDRARLTVYDPKDIRSKPVTIEMRVTGVHTRPTMYGPQTVIQFDQAPKFIVTAASKLRVFRDYGYPRVGFEGQVTSIVPVVNKVIVTEFETFELLPGQLLEYKLGDPVFRGQPVRPGLASAYDHTSAPGWHWITPEQWRRVLNFTIQDSTLGFTSNQVVEKYGTIEPPTAAGKFSLASLADLGYVPERGTLVTVIEDGSGETHDFRVVGMSDTDILMTPGAVKSISGMFQFRIAAEFQKLDHQQEYFEIAPFTTSSAGSGSVPSTLQAYPQRTGVSVLEAKTLTSFPQMGRVNILLAGGGVVEFEYFGRTDRRFLNCNWVSPFTALGSGAQIPIDARLILVAEYRNKRLNPAFGALAARRAKTIESGQPRSVQVTDDNADELYNLLKASTAVLELRHVEEPAALDLALSEVLPPGTSLEVLHKDVLVDKVHLPVADHTTSYEDISLTIVAKDSFSYELH